MGHVVVEPSAIEPRSLRHRSEHHRSRGQSVVEFALVLVPMLLLLLGAIQIGVIWATQVGVTNAVRDAARAASLTQPKDANGDVSQATEQTYATTIEATVLGPGLAANVPFYGSGNVQVDQVCYSSFTDATGTDTALRATVTVTYRHPIFVPLLAGILGPGGIATTSSLSIPVGMEKPYTLPTILTPAGCSP